MATHIVDLSARPEVLRNNSFSGERLEEAQGNKAGGRAS